MREYVGVVAYDSTSAFISRFLCIRDMTRYEFMSLNQQIGHFNGNDNDKTPKCSSTAMKYTQSPCHWMWCMWERKVTNDYYIVFFEFVYHGNRWNVLNTEFTDQNIIQIINRGERRRRRKNNCLALFFSSYTKPHQHQIYIIIWRPCKDHL